MIDLSDTPAGAIARLDQSLRRRGEDVIVRRYTSTAGDPRPKIDTPPLRAFVRAVKAEEMVGDIKATHSAIVLSPTGLAALLPLVKGDKVVVQGRERNVDLPKPILLDNQVVRINLMVAG